MTRMRVSLVTLGDPNQQTGGYLYHRRLAEAAPAHEADLRFVSIPDYPFPVSRVFGRRAATRTVEAHAVVIDSIVAAFVGPWLRRVHAPVVGMLHQVPGGIDHGRLRSYVQGVFDRRAYRAMAALFVASHSLGEELRDLHPNIRVVAPGRDVAASAHPEVVDVRRGRGIGILCVGNWMPRKGIVELLDAFAMLPPAAATLHLVGDESCDLRYARSIRRRMLNLGDRVVAHGVIAKERVAALYRDADVFALPSYREPYGTVYGEAMAMGLPVVGWRAGNLPYLAHHEREGLMVEPGDVRGLSGALRRLWEDDVLRRRLAEGARARAESFPTWEQTASAFFSALRRMVGEGEHAT